jgi:hypothetical protein
MTTSLGTVAIVLDAADPSRLAALCGEALGMELTDSGAESATLTGPSITVHVRRIARYRRPRWPQSPPGAHLDFAVPSGDEATERPLDLGATKSDDQPSGDDWVVFLGPGHRPFCIAAG